MNITLLRHPAVAAHGLCYGRSQVALLPEWLSQLPALRASLPQPLPQIYTSPAARCMVVAGFLGGPNVQADERLQELDFGHWEMLPWKDIPIDEMAAWTDDLEEAVPHCGESGLDLIERAGNFLEHLVNQDQDALIVTHAGWIRALLAILLNTDLAHAFRLDINYLSLTQIVINEDLVTISSINQNIVSP